MKRFYLESDTRFGEGKEIVYKQYKGWVRKDQTKKWLFLTVPYITRQGKIHYKKKFQLVLIKSECII